jgi:hypothetical protein
MDKEKISKIIHRFMLGCAFLLLNWFIISEVIVDVSFIKYCIIEAIILVSMKLYIALVYKLDL